jgi:hypothetical protein
MSKDDNTPEDKPTPIEIDGKVFNSIDELKEAYKAASTVIGRQGQELGGLRKQVQQVQQPNIDYTKLGESLEDNPGLTLQQIVESVTKNVLENQSATNNAQREEEKRWNKFFEKNSSLANYRDMVINDAYTRLWPSLENKSEAEQFTILEKHWSTLVPLQDKADFSGEAPGSDVAFGQRVTPTEKVDSAKPASIADALADLNK